MKRRADTPSELDRSSQVRRKHLILPENMRIELKTPLGTLLKGEPQTTVEKFRKLISQKNPPMYAIVGDFTSKNVLKADLNPDIVIVDQRVMRVKADPIKFDDRIILEIKNYPGTINAAVWDVVKEAITLKKGVAIIVEGEEDLMVLPLIILMPIGSLIVYGQPNMGMVIVEITKERKKWTDEFLSRMEEF